MMTKGRESEGSGWMKDERNSVQKSTRESKVCRLRAEQWFLLQSVLRPFLLFVLLLLRAERRGGDRSEDKDPSFNLDSAMGESVSA